MNKQYNSVCPTSAKKRKLLAILYLRRFTAHENVQIGCYDDFLWAKKISFAMIFRSHYRDYRLFETIFGAFKAYYVMSQKMFFCC